MDEFIRKGLRTSFLVPNFAGNMSDCGLKQLANRWKTDLNSGNFKTKQAGNKNIKACLITGHSPLRKHFDTLGEYLSTIKRTKQLW